MATDFEVRFAITGARRVAMRDKALARYNAGDHGGALKALLEYVAADYGCRLQTNKHGQVKMVPIDGCPLWPTGKMVTSNIVPR